MPYEEYFENDKKYKKGYKNLISQQAFNKAYIKNIKSDFLKRGNIKENDFKHPDKAMNIFKNNLIMHKEDKFYGFFHRSDKKCFISLENALEDLSNKMEKGVPNSLEGKHQDIEDIDNLYLKTIKICKEYLIKFCRFTITKEAKNRKYLVQYLLNYCTKERQLFRDKALELMYQKDERTLWKDILAESRIETIDITDREDIGKEGAATSEILTIGEGEDMKFFKDEEKLMSTEEAIDKLFPSVASFLDENDKKFLKEERGVPYSDIVDLINSMETNKPKEILQYIFSQVLSYKNSDKINDLNEIQDNQLLEMIKSIGKSDSLRYMAKDVAKIPDNSIISNRNVASSRMADLLGLGDIIAKSKKAKIKQAGKKSRVGNLMDKARGIPASKLLEIKAINPDLKFHISPNAKKQLMALQVLDTICGQIDRHLNNYFVTITENDKDVTIDSIQGIDNDLSFGNLKLDKMGKNKLPAFIDGEGQAIFNHMDKDLANRVLALSPEALKFIFADLISPGEIESLIERLEVVKSAIRAKSDKPNSEFLKDSAFFEKASPKELTDKDSYFSEICEALEIKD